MDPELLARGIPQVDLLKVAHHGSRTASTRPFLEAARPRIAVVSAGAGNPYGHPAPSTIERLGEIAGRTYRTDTDGSVEVTFDGPAVRVRTSGARPPPRPATPRPGATAATASPAYPAASAFLCGVVRNSLVAARPPTAPEAPAPLELRSARSVRSPRSATAPRRSDAFRTRRTAAQRPSATIGSMETTRASATAPGRGNAPLAYFWGDDAYGLDAALEAFRADPARFPDGPPERWRPEVDRGEPARLLGEIRERLGTGSMFGSGSVAIVRGAGALIRSNEGRDALLSALTTVAPGNGLAVLEETDSSAKEAPNKKLFEAIRDAGGVVRQLRAPREDGLATWIETRARERDIRLGPGAARELATRVGGFVREGDVERQQQGRTAVMQLEKLALRHAAGETVTVDDVTALVPEAVPGSMWAFVDAVAMRQRNKALELLERLIEDQPAPVLLAVLHRRIRELIEVQDRLERGESPGSLVRSMRLVPFRAETLARQAKGWSGPELDAALDGLVELDAQVKGVGGRASTDARDRLSFDLWITDRIATG